MSKHLLRLVQSGSTLYDFQDPAYAVTSSWKIAVYDNTKTCVEDKLVINPTGSSITTFLNNLNTLHRAIMTGNDNYNQWRDGFPYTPVFLQFKQDGQENVLQSEFLGGNTGEVENYLAGALRAKIIPNLELTLKRRPYWEETSDQTLGGASSVSNDGGYYELSGVRGDLESPLSISVTAATTNQDRVIIGCKARGTVANFVNKYQAEGYTARYTTGSSVADLVAGTEPNFSPGTGTVGQRWTVNTTSDVTLLSWDITANVADQLGTYRVFVRCRDNNSTFNVKIRVRAGVYTSGSSKQYGDYGDIYKYGDGTGTGGGTNSSPGTTAVPLIDCGIISLPPVDTQGKTPGRMIIELHAKADSTSGSPTFDVDYLILMPLYELPFQNGYVIADFPVDLGNSTTPTGIVTSKDRTPRAYLDASGTLQYSASQLRGNPLLVWNNKTVRVFVMTQRTSNLRHTYGINNSVTITATPRYRLPGRGS